MRLDSSRLVVPAILVGLATAGLAAAQQGGSTESRVARLEEQVRELQQTQESTLRRLDQLRLDLDNSLEPLRVRLADSGERLRTMESRMVALEEQMALTNETLSHLSEQIAAGATGSGPRVSGGPMPAPSRPAGMPGPAAVAERQERGEPAARSAADLLYSTAYTDYLAGNYGLAVSGFREFLEQYPSSPRAARARFMVGESLFSEERFAEAREAFLDVPRRHPEAVLVPEARYRAALVLVELDQPDRAAEELVRLIEERPGGQTLRLACGELERLGFDRPAACPAR